MRGTEAPALHLCLRGSLIFAWVVALLVGSVLPAQARPLAHPLGEITRLTATDAPDPGDVVVISSTVRANHHIPRSSLFYVVLSPDYTVIATRQVSVPRLQPGDTFSDSWSVSNSSFPSKGTYTVVLCWGRGSIQFPRCNIDVAWTTFYSVPTLGWPLSIVALGLLAVFLWRRRDVFRREGAL